MSLVRGKQEIKGRQGNGTNVMRIFLVFEKVSISSKEINVRPGTKNISSVLFHTFIANVIFIVSFSGISESPCLEHIPRTDTKHTYQTFLKNRFHLPSHPHALVPYAPTSLHHHGLIPYPHKGHKDKRAQGCKGKRVQGQKKLW